MFARLEKIAEILASGLLFVLMLLTFIDVVGRNLLNHPLVGASEMTEILLACLVFLLLPSAAFRQEHIVVDLIDGISGPVLRLIQKVLTGLLGCGLFALIAWRLWILGGKAAGYGDVSPSLGVPLAPVIYAMSMLAFINAAAFLLKMFRPTIHEESPEIAAAKRILEQQEERERGLKVFNSRLSESER